MGGFATATIADSRFVDHLAKAGDRGFGKFAALASGGAIVNDSLMTIVGSEFHGNQAFGGNRSTSPFHNGHSLGGAIISGSLFPAFGGPGATIELTDSWLIDNQAVGGNNNQVLLPADQIPPADGPNNGYGGGLLVFQGLATVQGSLFNADFYGRKLDDNF